MLLWRGNLWLIDHGSSLYFHHNWTGWEEAALSPFAYVRDHALLREASRMREADAMMHLAVTPELIARAVAELPEEWLRQAEPQIEPAEQRRVYREFMTRRLAASQIFTDHAIEARKKLLAL